jgi:20S proteasome subunit beta 4
METSFALTGKGYVIMAADTTAARSIVKMKIDEDKITTLSSHLIMAYSGEPGKFKLDHARFFVLAKLIRK